MRKKRHKSNYKLSFMINNPKAYDKNFAIHFPKKVKKIVIIAANASGLNNKEILLRNSTI